MAKSPVEQMGRPSPQIESRRSAQGKPMKMLGLPAGQSGAGFAAALMTLALFAATLGVAPCPAADQATFLASRTLLLDAQVFNQTIVAVGAGGHILRSTDSGHTWQLARTPTLTTLTGVHFPDERHGWAVGHDAIILHSEDGGQTWVSQYQGPDLQVSFLDVCFLDTQNGFVAGAYGQFLATTDGGRTWTPRRVIEEDFFLNRITAGPTGTLYLAGEHGTLLRSTDRGISWTPIRTPYEGSFFGILPLGPKTLLAHGLRGRIYRSEDDGDTWQLAPSEQRGLLATAIHLKNGVIIVAGQSRLFAVSRDEGRSFTPWAPGLTTGVAELVEAPDGTLLAIGEDGVTPLPTP
jgi:photosystem II stability/assembly factor-like uncharacterized protein